MYNPIMKIKRILITGTAGFIGFHLAKRLLAEGYDVFGVDNFNDYYSVDLKKARHAQLEACPNYAWATADLADQAALKKCFDDLKPDCAGNPAAQPGVRYSITNPDVYVESNLVGFVNILECCRHAEKMPKLLYASSSSVYGGNKEMPFSEDQPVDHPISLYAATKKANELMAHCYSHLYGMQTLGFRFFTVYGPWGRPDMAAYLFADAMSKGKPIKVFNHGDMMRDFTFVDDIVDGIVRVVESDALPAYDIFNIGNHRSEKLLDVINVLADSLGVEPKMEMLPMQPGDVYATYASIEKLNKAVGYEPKTTIREGIPVFAKWYREYHGL